MERKEIKLNHFSFYSVFAIITLIYFSIKCIQFYFKLEVPKGIWEAIIAIKNIFLTNNKFNLENLFFLLLAFIPPFLVYLFVKKIYKICNYFLSEEKIVISDEHFSYTRKLVMINFEKFEINLNEIKRITKIPMKIPSRFSTNIPALAILWYFKEQERILIKDKNGKEYKNVKTDENGKITTGKVYLKDVQNVVIKEVKAVGHYTIGKDNVKKLVLTQEEIEKNNLSKVKFENYQNFELTINKTTNANSKIRNLVAGQGIEDTYFSIYSVDNNGKIKDFAKNRDGKYLGTKTKLTFEDSSLNKEYYVFKTDKNGNVSIKELMKGNYIIREVKASKPFLNDSKDIKITLDENTSLTAPIVKFVNTPNTPNIHIEKEGLVETQPNDVIRYDFPDISNRSNVKLYNFTWEDNLPYDYVKMLKLYTGVWNEENTFKVYYKTNKIDWKELDGKDYSTLKNNFVSFENLNLDNINEYVTDFKLVFKNPVKKDFKATETPFIFVKVDSDLKDKDVFVNKTLDFGWTFDGEKVEDHAEWKTKTYKKTLKIKKLPRTGSEINNAIYFISAILIAGVIYFIKIK